MAEALYGADGFYRRGGAPGGNFRTAAHASPLWSTAVAGLAESVARRLPEAAPFTVVEVGAGGGELLTALADVAAPGWRLVGVDVCPRPAGLAARVEWRSDLPPAFDGLLLAVEWLDVVPVDVVELTDAGPCLVEVSMDGRERTGAGVDTDAARWLERWWPLDEVGDRAEVGATRDAAWADATARLRRGLAVAVDYGADPHRDLAGTLTGYRAGRQVLPVPDGSCDITAHVRMESCAAAVTEVDTLLVSQRDALRALGLRAQRPAYDGDPRAYLSELQGVGEAAELLDPSGLGGFTWLIQARGVALPEAFDTLRR
jgi:SAM-dependent MidA family methyltransferase